MVYNTPQKLRNQTEASQVGQLSGLIWDRFMYTPKLSVPPPLRGADAGSFAEHSIAQRLPHIAQGVLAENTLTSSMRHRIENLMAAIPHRTLEAFTDTEAPDMPGWQEYVRPYLDHNWLQVPW